MHESKETKTDPKAPLNHLFLAPIQVALDLGVAGPVRRLAHDLEGDVAAHGMAGERKARRRLGEDAAGGPVPG